MHGEVYRCLLRVAWELEQPVCRAHRGVFVFTLHDGSHLRVVADSAGRLRFSCEDRVRWARPWDHSRVLAIVRELASTPV